LQANAACDTADYGQKKGEFSGRGGDIVKRCSGAQTEKKAL